MLLLTRLCLVTIFLIAVMEVAQGMVFRMQPSPVDGKTNEVIAEGVIEAGDAARFERVVNSLPSPEARILVVTSLGGEVEAAKELAWMIKKRSYSVVVVRECASACAQNSLPCWGVFDPYTWVFARNSFLLDGGGSR